MTGTLTLSGNSNTLQQVPPDSFQATVKGVQSEDPTPSSPLIINWSDIVGKPTFGTASSRDVPAAGDASTLQVVLGNDTRLTDTRDTTSTRITDSTATGRAVLTATSATNAQAAIGGTAIGQALFTAADALSGRNTLGLGTISTQNANNVAITGGSISGITDLAVADGGTGASTASGARTNLGLVIGTDVQAQDAELQAIAGLTSAADKLPYFTGSGTAALTDLTSAARALLDDTTAAAQRATLVVSQTGPSFSAYRSGSVQIVANNIITEVVFNAELWDTDSAYNTSNGRFTPQLAGKYQINAGLILQSDGTDIQVGIIIIYKNGAEYKRGAELFAPTGLTQILGPVVSCLVDMNGTTDYISVWCYITRTTGPSYVQFSGGPQSWFDGYFVRT